MTQAVQAGKFPAPMDLEERLHIWSRAEVEGNIAAWAKARNQNK
ncbi:AlpA family regulatory protein [Stenotrophomonas phage BUCT627]|uniref:AlpA family regulatory protein n=2 Tax=Bixiavirus TaxID=3044676 RepID=A0AC61N9X3_9CAUD|nr:AlpA family regulatory protein [Stenotrophomonas phage BUCT626]YP_010677456.1 AlpA family regulatory protein [Stenotrophomonas phage BUCT627]QYC96656.1 AlpA family regulatory protein [Stenotrophomonas phage BUCT627]QYC96770.1 AlpA family regulatory protein [Stenotrophomonas phage BUCT626]